MLKEAVLGSREYYMSTHLSQPVVFAGIKEQLCKTV